MRKSFLIISIVLVSLFVIGAVSAADDVADVTAVSDDNEVQAIDNDVADDVTELQSEDEANEVQADDANDELSADGDTRIDLVVDEVAYDEDATINVTVVNNENMANKTVSVYLDDTLLKNLTTDASGRASHVIPAGTYGVGSYHIFAVMDTCINETMLKINKATPVVNVNDVEAVTGTVIKIPFNVTDSKGNSKGINGDAIVTIHWSDDVISHYVKVVDGKANVTFDISDLLGIFSGNGSSFNFNFTGIFGGNGTNRTGFNFTALFGENGTFNITNITTLFGGNGTNSTFNISSLLNMTGSFNFTNMFNFNKAVKFAYVLDVGTYNLTVTYLDSRNYTEASNDTAKLIITYADDVVYDCIIVSPEKLGDDTIAFIALCDKYGNPISNGTVSITLNGVDKGNVTLDENGTANITFEKLVNGDYELMLAYNGTNDTFGFSVIVPMKTTISCGDITITTVNVNVDGKIGKYLSVTLKDELGNVLANKTIQIAIDGKINTVSTDASGVAKLQLNIAKAGTYTASACFLGEDIYSSSFNIAKVNVNKQTPKLTTKNAKYKAKAKTKKLTATFKSASGKAIKGKKVTFTVKGKTYSAKTNAKGVATVKVKITKKGTYKFTAKFAGDDTYKAVSKKAKLVLK
jgi:hypothetical protein